MRDIKEIDIEFNKIKTNNKLHIDKKNKALSSLMSEIERDYNFPLTRNQLTIEQLNSDIYNLYLEISNSRNFDDKYYNEID